MQGIDRMLRPLRRGLAQLVSRAVVTLVNDATKMQTLQLSLLADEPLDGAEHWQPYGFTTVPHTGSEALVVSVGGHRAHSVVIACGDRRYRISGLKSGEVAIYTDEKDKVHLKRGRVIDIETHTLNIKAVQEVNFDTPVINTTGKIVSDGDQIAAGVSQVNHPHENTMPASGQQSGKPIAAGGA